MDSGHQGGNIGKLNLSAKHLGGKSGYMVKGEITGLDVMSTNNSP